MFPTRDDDSLTSGELSGTPRHGLLYDATNVSQRNNWPDSTSEEKAGKDKDIVDESYIHQVINMDYADKDPPQANGGTVNNATSNNAPTTTLPQLSAIPLPGAVVEPGPALQLLKACEDNRPAKVKQILATGLDTNAICDEKGRWPLHIASAHGFTDIVVMLLSAGAQKDQPDVLMERTPLHLASMAAADTVEALLRHGADVNARNKYGSNALHYAAGAGQAGCCRLLAMAGCELNARDRNKLTPLHVASRVGDVWCIEVLLEFGADVNARDKVGKTPLHHAAEGAGGTGTDDGKAAITLRRLVGAGGDANALDTEGKAVLFHAVQAGSAESIRALFDLGAELADGVSLLLMARTFPHLVRPFLDQCVKSNIDSFDPDSKNFCIQFDYTPLTYYPKGVPDTRLLGLQNRTETETLLTEMGTLHGLTRCRDTSILTHPLCESLLKLKWKKVNYYLYADMLLYAIFLSFLTAVIFIEYEAEDEEPMFVNETEHGTHMMLHLQNGSALSGGTTTTRRKVAVFCTDTPKSAALWAILWCLTSVLAIREIVQMFRGFLQYVQDVENLLEVSLLLSVCLLSFAECGIGGFVQARDHFAAVCLVVGWTIQVLLYGKIPLFGVYIRMYGAVAGSILGCIFTYLGLIFAFSLTLHFLFRNQDDFDSVWFTFLKAFAMMIGELDLTRTFVIHKPSVPFTSHFIFALFIVFISIILSCLLVSLAVVAISSMQRDNDYLQLVQLINVTSQLEDMLTQRAYLYPHLGSRDAKSLHMRKGVIYPNIKDHGRLTKDSMEIVINQHMKRKATSSSPKSSLELAEDLLQKLRLKLDKYILDVEKKGERMMKELHTYERCADKLADEVRALKFELVRAVDRLSGESNSSTVGEDGSPRSVNMDTR